MTALPDFEFAVPGLPKNPTNEQAMQIAKASRAGLEVVSVGGQLSARSAKGRSDKWHIRRVGSVRGKLCKSFLTMDTRNKKAVQAVLDALEPFHLKDAL